jgi:hypothetical protein
MTMLGSFDSKFPECRQCRNVDRRGASGSRGIYNLRVSKLKAATVWKALATTGAIATIIGMVAYGIDFLSVGEFSFISDHFEIFLLLIAVGVALLMTGLVGWAATLGKKGRMRIAFPVIGMPLVVIAIGYCLGGTNVHGLFFLFLFAMAPLIVIGLVLVIMAASVRGT